MKTVHHRSASQLADLLTDEQLATVGAVIRDLSVELLTCRYWRLEQANTRDRRLPDLLIYAPTVGRCRWVIDEVEHVVGPGDVVLVPEGVAHSMYLADDCRRLEAYSIHAHVLVSPAAPCLDLRAMPVIRLRDPAATHERLGVLTCLMGRAPDAGRRYGAELVRGLLVDQALQGAPMQPARAVIDARIVSVLSYIAHHPAEPLTVESLAAVADLSVSRFRVLFRAATGSSPKRYVRDQRLSKVRSLLSREPDLTVQQVAERTGFNDAHYLHQVFRECVGQTPGDFRAEIYGQ